MRTDDPYHEGEKRVQTRAGEQDAAARNGRAINTAIMPGALKFVAQQSMAVLGSVGAAGDVWASVLTGPRGFVTAPDPGRMLFDLSAAGSYEGDPFWSNIDADERIGALMIELETRRRLRVNGRMRRVEEGALELTVDEAYPNCPRFIQRRQVRGGGGVERGEGGGGVESSEVLSGVVLGTEQKAWIEGADTFFVASVHGEGRAKEEEGGAGGGGGADVSHRGGARGFVRVLGDGILRVPDYGGNSMYNTLGNFEMNDRAGLVFVDFEGDRVLQMTGRVEVRWDLEEQAGQPSGGTQRYWDFHVDRWVEGDLEYGLGATFLDAWDKNPRAGGG